MKRHVRSLIHLLRDKVGRRHLRRGAEIGVERGHTSEALLRRYGRLTLVMVDIWAPMPRESSMGVVTQDGADDAMREALGRTEFAASRRVVRKMTSVEAARAEANGALDFAFFDADHFDVARDLVAWFLKVREGGLYCGHDYDGVGDRRHGWGVKRAVDEFAERHGYKVNTEPGLVWWFVK